MQKTGPASIRPTPSLTLGTPYIFSAAAVDSATLLYSCALPDHRPADPQIVAQPEEDGVGRLELLEHTPLAAPRPLLGPLRRPHQHDAYRTVAATESTRQTPQHRPDAAPSVQDATTHMCTLRAAQGRGGAAAYQQDGEHRADVAFQKLSRSVVAVSCAGP